MSRIGSRARHLYLYAEVEETANGMKRANEIESRLFLPQLPRSLLIHTLIQFHQLTLHGVPLLHLTRDFVCGSLLLTLFQAFYFLLWEIYFKSRASAIAFMIPGQATANLR